MPNAGDIHDLVSRSSVWPNPLTAHLAYLVSETAMRIIFWISIIGKLPNPLPGPPRFAKLISSARIGAKLGAALASWLSFGALVGLLPWQAPASLLVLFGVAWIGANYADEKAGFLFNLALKP